ncbi:adenylyltransferase/cytidyltransferase family protein [Streptomyces sp. NPDC055239]
MPDGEGDSCAHVTPTRANVYVDMVGDLFHPGHVALLKAARACGERLLVGVFSDEVVTKYKRRPIMTLAERVTVIEACRYVDAVIPNAPERVTTEFLEDHDIAMVVHGDDISPDAIEDVFGPVAAAGKLQLVPYTAGVSTTDLIRRCLARDVSL